VPISIRKPRNLFRILGDHKYSREVSTPGRIMLNISLAALEVLVHPNENVCRERAPSERKSNARIGLGSNSSSPHGRNMSKPKFPCF
jgi:hypothetical protein